MSAGEGDVNESADGGEVFYRCDLLRLASEVLARRGMRANEADIMADSLVDAEWRGVATHGLVRLPAYARQLGEGEVNARPDTTVVVEREAAVLLDADGGFGAPVGVAAMRRAVDFAQKSGIGFAGVRRVAHFGSASYYSRLAAGAGCYGIAISSTSAVVAPWGGAVARIGNNPVSIAAPAMGGQDAMVTDMAMSAVSRGRIKLALEYGEQLPLGWAVDKNGNPTTEPAEALNGALLPMAGPKGSGLSIAFEMLAAALTGAQLTQDVFHSGFTSSTGRRGRDQQGRTDVTVGNAYIAIDAGAFGDFAGSLRRNQRILDHVRSCPTAEGVDKVRAPGDVEVEFGDSAGGGRVRVSRIAVEALITVARDVGIREPRPVDKERG